MRTVATAGHVDHGKSSLVRALTGTDPDRLAEEKARGLTIELGFAFTTLASGVEIGFVDVPGHVRFIGNMLAGVGVVDVAMLVVSAGECWMPQTEEHFQILELLGVDHGVVVITQSDTVDADSLLLATSSVADRLRHTSWRDAPIVVCDSVSGRGLDDLRTALDAVLAATPAPIDHDRPRLWVDRVFTITGAGTVVTGTLAGGSLTVDDAVVIARTGLPARVRSIESGHRETERVEPGARVALNLAGVDHHVVVRGDAVVRAGQWTTASTVDVALQPLAPASLTGTVRLHAHVGSGEHDVRLRPIGSDGGFARLRFDIPLALAPGDRVVLRDPGPAVTVGGATVLDVDPATSVRDAPRVLALPLGARLVEGHDWISRADLPRVSGLARADADTLAATTVDGGHAVGIGDWLVAPSALADLRARAGARVAERHRDRPLAPAVDLGGLAAELGVDVGRLRGALLDQPEFVVEHGTVRDARSIRRATDSDAGRSLVAELDASPWAPSQPSDAALARALVREGTLTDVDGILFTTDAVDRARRLIAAAVVERGSLSIADARGLLDTSRKYVVPLLTRFDAEGVTRRRGDARIPGPRAGAHRAETGATDEPRPD